MPSPLGHALGAFAAGVSVVGIAAAGRDRWKQIAILVAVGIAPDLDLLWGRHSRETHSLGAALIVAGVAAWQHWPVASTRLRVFLAVLLAWFSHPILDAFSSDTSMPIGVQLWWPLSLEFYSTGLDWFGPISRRYWLDNFWTINLTSIAREVLFLAPVAGMVAWFRSSGGPRSRSSGVPRRTSELRDSGTSEPRQ